MSVKTKVSLSDVLVSSNEVDELKTDIKMLRRIVKELYRQNKNMKKNLVDVSNQASAAEEAANQLRIEMELTRANMNSTLN